MPLALAAALALNLSSSPAAPPPPALAFEHLFVTGPSGARVAPEVAALAGRRVRLAGHPVHMEEPPRGAFYLAARPVEADESGGGTGDLPPGAVRVEVRGLEGPLPALDGAVEVEGLLDVGRAEDADGRVSWIRILVDLPRSTPTTQENTR
ncbi:MAG: hypothetical protein QM704_25095 [Anaeromyxobacteraceae bacterium]